MTDLQPQLASVQELGQLKGLTKNPTYQFNKCFVPLIASRVPVHFV